MLGSIWVSQIYTNTVKGVRGIPEQNYAGWMTSWITFMPMYALLIDKNICFFEPSFGKAFLLAVWVFAQLGILKVQQNSPRFLLPEGYRRELVGDDYYNYKRSFVDEAYETRERLLREYQRSD